MLVGVISDTHDVLPGIDRAVEVFRREGVEHVIHLGDYVAPFSLLRLLDQLDGVRFNGVFGNNDGEKPGLLRIAEKHGSWISDQGLEVEVGGRRVLLLHGFGSPDNTRRIVYALASSRKWDAVLYGHTHQPDVRYIRGVLVLNPGTASGILNSASVAILDTRRMTARVIRI